MRGKPNSPLMLDVQVIMSNNTSSERASLFPEGTPAFPTNSPFILPTNRRFAVLSLLLNLFLLGGCAYLVFRIRVTRLRGNTLPGLTTSKIILRAITYVFTLSVVSQRMIAPESIASKLTTLQRCFAFRIQRVAHALD